MLIKDLMTKDFACVTPDATLPEVAQKMKDADTGAIPIVDASDPNRVIGIITDRDIALRAVAQCIDLNNAKVGDYMTKAPRCVAPTTDTSEAANIMSDLQLKRLCVVDESNKLVGMLSLGDLAVKEHDLAEEALEGISHGAKAEYYPGTEATEPPGSSPGAQP